MTKTYYPSRCSGCLQPLHDLDKLFEMLHKDWHNLVDLIRETGTEEQKKALEKLECMPRRLSFPKTAPNDPALY